MPDLFILPAEAVARLCVLYDLDPQALNERQLADALSRAAVDHSPPCGCEKCVAFDRVLEGQRG